MYPPILPGKGHHPGEEDVGQEKRLQELSRGYEDSPWLTALVVFSGFLVAFVGTFDTLFLVGTAVTGREWWPYAVILAALAGTHLFLRAIRFGRRRAKQSGARRSVSDPLGDGVGGKDGQLLPPPVL